MVRYGVWMKQPRVVPRALGLLEPCDRTVTPSRAGQGSLTGARTSDKLSVWRDLCRDREPTSRRMGADETGSRPVLYRIRTAARAKLAVARGGSRWLAEGALLAVLLCSIVDLGAQNGDLQRVKTLASHGDRSSSSDQLSLVEDAPELLGTQSTPLPLLSNTVLFVQTQRNPRLRGSKSSEFLSFVPAHGNMLLLQTGGHAPLAHPVR